VPKKIPSLPMGTGVIDAYYHDHQWHPVLDPLYGKFQDWKTGNASHLEMDEAIHETHKSWQKVYSLFTLNLSDNLLVFRARSVLRRVGCIPLLLFTQITNFTCFTFFPSAYKCWCNRILESQWIGFG